MLKANTGFVRLLAILQYSNMQQKQYIHKTKHALLHNSRIYKNVYIGIRRSICMYMYKDRFLKIVQLSSSPVSSVGRAQVCYQIRHAGNNQIMSTREKFKSLLVVNTTI